MFSLNIATSPEWKGKFTFILLVVQTAYICSLINKTLSLCLQCVLPLCSTGWTFTLISLARQCYTPCQNTQPHIKFTFAYFAKGTDQIAWLEECKRNSIWMMKVPWKQLTHISTAYNLCGCTSLWNLVGIFLFIYYSSAI